MDLPTIISIQCRTDKGGKKEKRVPTASTKEYRPTIMAYINGILLTFVTKNARKFAVCIKITVLFE